MDDDIGSLTKRQTVGLWAGFVVLLALLPLAAYWVVTGDTPEAGPRFESFTDSYGRACTQTHRGLDCDYMPLLQR